MTLRTTTSDTAHGLLLIAIEPDLSWIFKQACVAETMQGQRIGIGRAESQGRADANWGNM